MQDPEVRQLRREVAELRDALDERDEALRKVQAQLDGIDVLARVVRAGGRGPRLRLTG